MSKVVYDLSTASASESSSRRQPLSCLLKTIISFLIAFLAFPFIICDLYFALYKPYSCQHEKSSYFPGFNLSIWLIVCASGASTNALLGFLCVCFSQFLKPEEVFSKKYSLVLRYTGLIWTIVGSVFFWRDIEPRGHCTRPIINYIYTRLIFSFISFFISEHYANKKEST